MIFLSTPSARRATQSSCAASARGQISIHALREEGDRKIMKTTMDRGISIHALREEGDKKPLDYGILGVTFLSTPSARRAT